MSFAITVQGIHESALTDREKERLADCVLTFLEGEFHEHPDRVDVEGYGDPPRSVEPEHTSGVDLRTVSTVDLANEYRVRTGKLEDWSGYQASVVGTRKSPLARSMETAVFGSSDEYSGVVDSPRVVRSRKYEAAGAAVAAFLVAEEAAMDEEEGRADG